MSGDADEGQPTFPKTPVNWSRLKPEEVVLKLDDLGRWVDRTMKRYALDPRTIPPCWPEHGALIEELAALHTAWNGAYCAIASSDSALKWHSDFASARLRLGDWVSRSGCRPSEHRSDGSVDPGLSGRQ